MKILRQNKGEAVKLAKYCRNDMEPISDATDKVKWFILAETERPPVNQFEILRTEFVTTDKPHEKYPHFFIANEVHTVERISDERVIQMLNESLGSHLDENYPLWKRQKHLLEIIEGVEGERLQYIERLKKWEFDCRASRDKKEFELINNNQLPTFDWEAVPQN